MSGKVIDLSCPKCGSNRLRFPVADEDPVSCEDCGTAGKSLHEVKLLMTGSSKRSAPEKRSERKKRHVSEVEVSQANLRESVAETDRLVVASDDMLRRHREECDQDDAA
ncbi:MAG TPA: hypothetical protein VF582_09145 [Allosphingosinicella sp.]|jgi:predicted  nucleic acid-binding Zn-ribbon protein